VQRLDEFGHIRRQLRRRFNYLELDRFDQLGEGPAIAQRPDQRSDRVEAVMPASVELGHQATFIQDLIGGSRIAPHDHVLGDQYLLLNRWLSNVIECA